MLGSSSSSAHLTLLEEFAREREECCVWRGGNIYCFSSCRLSNMFKRPRSNERVDLEWIRGRERGINVFIWIYSYTHFSPSFLSFSPPTTFNNPQIRSPNLATLSRARYPQPPLHLNISIQKRYKKAKQSKATSKLVSQRQEMPNI